MTLHYAPGGDGRARLTYLEAAPVLRKPDLSAFEKAVLLLDSLYQYLELDVSATGQLLALATTLDKLFMPFGTCLVKNNLLAPKSGTST